MNIIYDNMINETQNIYRGGFEVISNIENEMNGITVGGGKKQFHNKAIPFGLAMKRIKHQKNYECKNGDVLDKTMFEKLFQSIATVNSFEKKERKNTTRKRKK